MAQLPYINLPQSQAPGIIGDIGDSLVAAARNKQQQQQAAIDNLLKQKQMQAQEAQMRAQEARALAEAARQEHYAVQEQHRLEQQQRKEAADALKPMSDMIAANDVTGAQALGQIHGYNFKLVNGLEAPGAAPQAPQPGAAGPIPSPEDRDFAASQPGDMNQPDQSGAGMVAASDQAQAQDQQMASGREQYAAALAAHPQLVAEHAKRVQDYTQAKENPIYRGEGPFGPVEFNPGAARAQQEQQREQTATAMSQGLPPKYQIMLAAKIKGGVSKEMAAQQIDSLMKGDEDRTLRQQHEDQQLTRDQRFAAQLAAAAGRGQGARITAGAADNRQARTQYHADIAKDAGVIEKEYRAPYVEAKKGIQFLDANPGNPEAWVGARDMLSKAFSGGKVTKSQYDLAAEHSAPKSDKLAQLYESWTSGLPSPTQQKNLRAALAALSKAYEQPLRAKATEFDETYGQDPLALEDKTVAGTFKRHRQRLFGDVPKEEAKPADGDAHPAAAPVGETRKGPDGKMYRKVGPNDWQPL